MLRITTMRGGVLAVLCAFSPANAYEVTTHATLSYQAAVDSVLGADPSLLADLGIADGARRVPNRQGEMHSVFELVREGSVLEDEGERALNHFFDPQNDRPLYVFFQEIGEKSPDWALEHDSAIEEQTRSYTDGYTFYRMALTAPAADVRELNYELMFQTLGHAIHHLQDMAQPDHVRNDQHCNQYRCVTLYDPSAYEHFTAVHGLDQRLLSGYETVVLPRAVDYWASDGQGIAEFTSRNFVSKDTNFTGTRQQPQTHPEFPLPSPANAQIQSVQIADLLGPVGPNQHLIGDMQFIGTQVTDGYAPQTSRLNPRTSTYSLFDADLENYAGLSKIYTLNRFNFLAAHEFLIPRAMGYSTGLINHFFRGRMAIDSLASEGSVLSLIIRNTSAEDYAWQDGKFEVFYDAAAGERRPATVLDGTGTLRASLAADGLHMLRIAMPADVDPSSATPFVVVFTGQIGAERGVASKFFGGSAGSFDFTPSATPADGLVGPRVLMERNGAWRLASTSSGSGGNVDWKGKYVDGRPTEVLSWSGPQSRYFVQNQGTSFGTTIYRNGDAFSVAPCPVLGAAINTDAAPQDWLVIICARNGGEAALRRPAAHSTSAALYDPVAAPGGWRLIGEVPRLATVDAIDTPWLFDGSGIAATAMRTTPEGNPTRVQAQVSADVFTVTDVDNTEITTSVEWESVWQQCEGIYHEGSVWESRTWREEGTTVVAADYIGDQLVLGRVRVEAEGYRTTDGHQAVADNNPYTFQILDNQSLRRETLELPSGNLMLVEEESNLDATSDFANGSHREDANSYLARTVLALDLRYNFVLYSETGDSSHSYAMLPPATSVGGERQWTYQESHGLVAKDGGQSEPLQNESSTPESGTSTYNGGDWLWDPIGRCFDAPHANKDERGSDSDSYYATLPYVPLEGRFAHNRGGKLFLSLQHEDPTGSVNTYGYLTGGDPFSVVGVPQETLFQNISPR